MKKNHRNIIIHIFALTCALLCTGINCLAADGLTEWHGIVSKKHILRIVHDEKNIYVSSSGAGVTVIDKQSGQQTTFNRANEMSFDNNILDMNLSYNEIWASGRFYGFGKLYDFGACKFDMLQAGCISSQWMQGILVKNPTDILLGGLLAFYSFDGSQCNYTYRFNELSPMAMVTDIKETENGKVFVSSQDWSVRGNSFYEFTDGILTPIDNPCSFVNRLSVSGNTVWLASEGNGLVKYENGSFTEYNSDNSGIPDNHIADICTDSQGDIWMVSPTHIIKYSDGIFSSKSLSDEYVRKNERFTAIDVDGSVVYAGTQYHGLLKFENNDLTVIDLNDNPEFGNTTPIAYRGSSCMDCDGNFMMVSGEGLNVYNSVTGMSRIIRFYFADLREVCVSPVNGDIWLRKADSDSCLVKIDDNGAILMSFSNHSVPLSLSETFNIMAFDNNGYLWVAAADGLLCYDGETWKHFTEKDAGFPISNIKCLAVDGKNHIWCGAFGENRIGNGLIMYDGIKWHNYKTNNSQIPSNFVGSISLDNNDVVWLNCRDSSYPEVDMYGYGLTSFDGEKWTTYNTSNSDICSNHIYSIEIDRDNTKWLATTGDRGVMSFDGSDWRLYSVDNSGIALNTANDITIDTKNDFIYFVHPLGNGVSCAKLTAKHGGISNVVNDFGGSMIGQQVTIYNIQGCKVYYTPNYQGEPLDVPSDIYIIVTPKGSHKRKIDQSTTL